MEGELAKLVLNEKLCRKKVMDACPGPAEECKRCPSDPCWNKALGQITRRGPKSEKNSAPFTRNRIVFSVKLSTIFILRLVLGALTGSGTTNKDLSG